MSKYNDYDTSRGLVMLGDYLGDVILEILHEVGKPGSTYNKADVGKWAVDLTRIKWRIDEYAGDAADLEKAIPSDFVPPEDDYPEPDPEEV